jgi:hypothetical protein
MKHKASPAPAPVEEARLQRFSDRLLRACDRVGTAVCPVLVPKGRRTLEFIGSAVLLRVGPRELLITAAHVAAQTSDGWFVAGTSRLAELRGEYFVTPQDHAFDLAVFPLRDEHVQRLSDCTFLDVSAIDVRRGSEIPRDETLVFMPFGFPASQQGWTRERPVNVRPFRYGADEVDDATYSAAARSRDSHLLVWYPRKLGRTPSGEHITGPKLQGMSGGAIFALNGVEPESERETLAGIPIEHHERPADFVVGTRGRHVLGAVWQSMPELRRYIEAGLAAR